MSTTPTDPVAPNTATLRAALQHKLTEAARGAGIAIRDDALSDLARQAAAELTLDERGFTVRASDGRFVPALEWLTSAQNTSPWYFHQPAGSTTGRSGQPLPAGAVKRISAGEMKHHLEDIVAGRVVVELTGDPTK